MGENKAFLTVGGKRMIDRTVRIFKGIFDEIILVTNSPLEYLDQDVMIVTDIIPEKGPLGGIYTGLFYSYHPHAFVAACDMPFLNGSFIRFMIGQVARNDIVVPETLDGMQPLHAIYSQKCLKEIRRLLGAEKLRITDLYRRFRTLKIISEMITPYDSELRIFSNINAPEDLIKYSKT
jgi:molybdopterin-guanine dinucleotide biosynthesis protein A